MSAARSDKRALAPLLLVVACLPVARLDMGALLTVNESPYHWAADAFPVAVSVPSDDKRLLESARLAIAAWNGAAGRDVFALEQMPPAWDAFATEAAQQWRVTVARASLGVGSVGRIRGMTSIHLRTGWRGAAGEIGGAVVHMDTASDTDEALILTHELGHALGLAHDIYDAQSVMHPTAPTGSTIQEADAIRVHNQTFPGPPLSWPPRRR